jgi:tRNA A-37 threonylcarbamoyl transferase component Bud32
MDRTRSLERFKLLYRNTTLPEEQVHTDFDIWYHFTKLKRLRSGHFNEDKASFVCHMAKEHEIFFRTLLQLPQQVKRHSTTTICSEMSRLLIHHKQTYRVSRFKNSGSYGVILEGFTELGEKMIIKMYNLSSRDGVDPQNLPWFPISETKYQRYSRNLALLSGVLPSIAPSFLGSQVLALGRGVAFGIMFMTYVGDQDLFHALNAGTASVQAALAHSTGLVLRRMHDAGFVHGDAHTGNFVVMDQHKNHVVVVDTDHITAFTEDYLHWFERSRCLDIGMLLDSIARQNLGSQHQLFEQFAIGYQQQSRKAAQEFLDTHLMTTDIIAAERAHYDRISKIVMA